MSRSRHTYFRVPGRPPSPGLESCVRGSVLVKIGSYSYRLSKWSTVQTPRVPNTCTAEQCNRMLAQVTDIPHSVKRLALQYMQLFAVPLSRERSCHSIGADRVRSPLFGLRVISMICSIMLLARSSRCFHSFYGYVARKSKSEFAY